MAAGRQLQAPPARGFPTHAPACAKPPIEAIIPRSVRGFRWPVAKIAAHPDPRPGLDRARPAGRTRRHVGLGARQAQRPRRHHLQQIQARHRRRPRALAVDRIGLQGARRHQFLDRDFRAVDRRRRARRAIGAVVGLGASRRRRPFRRQRISGRQGLGRGGAAVGRRRARLCAGNFRRLDEAGLSRRRHHRRFAGHADPARRPRRGEDLGRRGDGQGIEAPHRQALELQSLNPDHADRTLDADEVAWIARIVWASQ